MKKLSSALMPNLNSSVASEAFKATMEHFPNISGALLSRSSETISSVFELDIPTLTQSQVSSFKQHQRDLRIKSLEMLLLSLAYVSKEAYSFFISEYANRLENRINALIYKIEAEKSLLAKDKKKNSKPDPLEAAAPYSPSNLDQVYELIELIDIAGVDEKEVARKLKISMPRLEEILSAQSALTKEEAIAVKELVEEYANEPVPK